MTKLTKDQIKAYMLEQLEFISGITEGLQECIERDDFSVSTLMWIEELSDRVRDVDELFTDWEDAK